MGARHGSGSSVPLPLTKVDIGKREVVGFGGNGEATYIDSVMSPFPAIRFKEDVGEIANLREKEKGDWKKMTLAEKKQLYRASFCQTLVEIEAPTGEWKSILGMTLVMAAMGMLSYIWMKEYVYGDLVDTITDEEKLKAIYKRMVDERTNPIEGFASNYDYEKGRW